MTSDTVLRVLADRYGAQACERYGRTGCVESRLILLAAPTDTRSPAAVGVEVGAAYEMPKQLIESATRTSMAHLALHTLIQALLDQDGAIHGAIVCRSGFHPNYAVQINLCWVGLRNTGTAYDAAANIADDPDADPAILVTVHGVGRSEANCHIIQPAFRTAHFQRYRNQHFRHALTLGRFEIEN